MKKRSVYIAGDEPMKVDGYHFARIFDKSDFAHVMLDSVWLIYHNDDWEIFNSNEVFTSKVKAQKHIDDKIEQDILRCNKAIEFNTLALNSLQYKKSKRKLK